MPADEYAAWAFRVTEPSLHERRVLSLLAGQRADLHNIYRKQGAATVSPETFAPYLKEERPEETEDEKRDRLLAERRAMRGQ